MRNLYPALLFFLVLVPVVFAIDGPPPPGDPPPDPIEQPAGAPASVWFEQNETLHYDTGKFSINWTPVDDPSVTNYTVYVLAVPNGNISKAVVRFYFTTVNPGETGILFGSTANGINYSFRISANNNSDVGGPNATSDWMVVDTVNPKPVFVSPTPANKSYLMNTTLTLLLRSEEKLSSIILNWGGTNEPGNITAIGQGSGYYYYYLSKSIRSEGMYFYSLIAQDLATNVGLTELRAVTYDLTSPFIVLTDPKNITYRSTKVPLKYRTYDLSQVSCRYEYESVYTQIANCANTTFTAIDNSTTTITLWVTDSAGNANFVSVEVTVNTSALPPPVILSTYPQKGMVVDPTSGIRNAILFAVTTDSVSECKYALVPNTSFQGMPRKFEHTNSTIHSTTITLAPNIRYNYYIRCKTIDGEENLADYVLDFTTASLLQIDPFVAISRNGSINFEVVAGKAAAFSIPVRNMAQYPLTQLKTYVGGTAAPYINITLPSEGIPINSTADIALFVNATREGSFRANIMISSENLSSNVSINLTVFNDFFSGLSDLKILQRDISSRLYSLRLKGVNVADRLVLSGKLQSDVDDAIALYDSGQYAGARKEYLKLTFTAANLSQSVRVTESQILLAGKGNSTAGATGYGAGEGNGAGTTGGSRIFWYTLIGIIIIIVAVVLITSIVPDDDKNSARELLKPRWLHSKDENLKLHT